MTEQPKEKKLIGKLCEVMEEVQYIQRTGFNKMQNYRYAQEADVVEKCRAELAKRKVWLKHSVKEVTNNRTVKTRSGGEMTVIRAIVEFTFIDAETGERETFTEPGEGMDSGDKAIYKAITGALKYALMKSFMIPTGDDPERDGEEAPKQQPRQQQPKPQQQGEGGRQPAQKTGLASDKQRKAVFAIAKGKGLEEPQIKQLVYHFTKKDSTKELTGRQASHLIETLKATEGPDLLEMIGEVAHV